MNKKLLLIIACTIISLHHNINNAMRRLIHHTQTKTQTKALKKSTPQFANLTVFDTTGTAIPATDPRIKTKPLIDTLVGNRTSNPTHITATSLNNTVFVLPTPKLGMKFFFPSNMPETFDTRILDEKGWQIRVGGFGVIENYKDEMLFIQRKDKSWYVPGGLMEDGDESLLLATMREVREETGLDLAIVNKNGFGVHEVPVPMHAYESITNDDNGLLTHRTLMFFYRFVGDSWLNNFNDAKLVPQKDECLDVQWIAPYKFLHNYMQNPHYSKSSIKIIFEQWAEKKIAEKNFDNQMALAVEVYKNLLIDKGGDPLLFNLVLIEAYSNLEGMDVHEWLSNIYQTSLRLSAEIKK